MLEKVMKEMDKAVRNSLLMVGRMILILSILGRTKKKGYEQKSKIRRLDLAFFYLVKTINTYLAMSKPTLTPS